MLESCLGSQVYEEQRGHEQRLREQHGVQAGERGTGCCPVEEEAELIRGKGLNGDKNSKCLEDGEKGGISLGNGEGIAEESRAFAA